MSFLLSDLEEEELELDEEEADDDETDALSPLSSSSSCFAVRVVGSSASMFFASPGPLVSSGGSGFSFLALASLSSPCGGSLVSLGGNGSSLSGLASFSSTCGGSLVSLGGNGSSLSALSLSSSLTFPISLSSSFELSSELNDDDWDESSFSDAFDNADYFPVGGSVPAFALLFFSSSFSSSSLCSSLSTSNDGCC